jgi:short-subunit dehydrogenase
MKFITSWALIYLFIWWAVPEKSIPILLSLTIFHILIWTILCGGLSAVKEIIEARTQPNLPLIPPHPARKPVVVVIGSAKGLGKNVVELAKRKKYIVQEGDVLFNDERYCDLTSVNSIKKFANSIIGNIDVLVLVAGVCDGTFVPVQNSSYPRMLWVNYLGQVCLLEELKLLGIEIKKIVSVTSGSYARGNTKEFYGKSWNVMNAVKYYSQSKFLLTTYFSRLQAYGKNVIMMNPGPMRSTIGDRHVPLLLYPSYGLMKEVLFPLPIEAAKAVIHCIDTKKKIDYMHIRIGSTLLKLVQDSKIQNWVMQHTQKALEDWYLELE